MLEECNQTISVNPEVILTGCDQAKGQALAGVWQANWIEGFAHFIIRACVCC